MLNDNPPKGQLHPKFKKNFFTSSVKDHIPFKPHLGFERDVK